MALGQAVLELLTKTIFCISQEMGISTFNRTICFKIVILFFKNVWTNNFEIALETYSISVSRGCTKVHASKLLENGKNNNRSPWDEINN